MLSSSYHCAGLCGVGGKLFAYMIYYRVRRKGARAEAMECKQPSLLKWGALSFTDAVVRLGTQLSCEHSCSFAVVSSQDDFQLRSLPLSSTHSPIHPQTHQTLLGNFHPSCQLVLASGLSLCGCKSLLGACSPEPVFRDL